MPDAKAAVRAAMNEVACAQLLEEFKAAMKARGAGTAMSESKEPMAAYVGLAHFMRCVSIYTSAVAAAPVAAFTHSWAFLRTEQAD